MTVTDPENADLPRLAKPGEVRGFVPPTTLDDKYLAAAKMALDNVGQAVIVEAYPWPNGDAATKKQEAEAARRAAQAVTKVQLPALNRWDAEEGGYEGDGERFHVGYSNNEDQEAVLTYVAFYPEGRPVRHRAAADD